jgi:predicted transcriptional regulator
MSGSDPVISSKSSIQLLQEINSGQTDPGLLDKPSRQQCIELLIAEGYTHSQIAQLLKCSEKTVSRDIKEIRARNELTPSVPFAKQFIGDMLKKAMNHHAYLMRLARMKNIPAADKIQAESSAWKVIKEVCEKLQSLGYLPCRPQEVVGDIFHQLDDKE